MRFITVIVVVLGWAAAASATAAKAPAPEDRYLVWVEASVTDSWRLDRTTVEGGCTRRAGRALTKELTLRSGWQSLLVATRSHRTTFLRGTVRALVGSLTGKGGGADTSSCALYVVITDYGLPMAGPVPISNASLDVRADPGKPVTFSNLRGISSRFGAEIGALINALSRAPGSLTPKQLREAKFRKVDVTGSYNSELTSGDGTEVRSLVVNWKLTIRALPRKP